MLRSEKLHVNDSEVDSWVVFLDLRVGRSLPWVDKGRYLLCRDHSTLRTMMRNTNSPLHMRHTSKVESARVNDEVSPDVFSAFRRRDGPSKVQDEDPRSAANQKLSKRKPGRVEAARVRARKRHLKSVSDYALACLAPVLGRPLISTLRGNAADAMGQPGRLGLRSAAGDGCGMRRQAALSPVCRHTS